MRSSKSRSRNKSNRNNRSPANNINRVFDSSGPEGKVRGTPQQIIDKYTQLARDASLGNDRVAAENFQQHAEHYTRLLAEAQRDAEAGRARAEQANRERQQRADRDRGDKRPQREPDNSSAPNDDLPGFITAPAKGEGEQPAASDALGVAGDAQPAEDFGLVETPETQPKKPARTRKPRAPKAAKPAADDEADSKSGPNDSSGAAAE